MERKRWYRYLTLILAFLIGNYKGYIALWRTSEEKPLKVFPYCVTSLPRTDQQRINAGIHVETEDDLLHLLEDFLS